jgi:hypothetical protein
MPQSGFEDGFTLASSGSLDTWVKEIFAKVPGAVEGYIYEQLKLVIKDFFQRTKAWQTYTGPWTALADDGTITLNPVDASSAVIQVLSVVRNGSPLMPVKPHSVPFLIVNDTSSKVPTRFYLEPYDVIKLFPVPSEDIDNIYVGCALTPRLCNGKYLEQWVIDQHYEVILAGTLQRLYQEPGKVYSNAASAEYWGKRYRSELVRSRVVGEQNYTSRTSFYPTWSR